MRQACAWQSCFSDQGDAVEEDAGPGAICATGSRDGQAHNRWCAATLSYSLCNGDGVPATAGSACAVAGRALGRSLRACLEKHGLTEEHLISLRLSVVTEFSGHHVTCELRKAFLDVMYPESQVPQTPPLRDSAEGEAVRRGCRQITVISAEKLSVARATSLGSAQGMPTETSILLEAVASHAPPHRE